MKLLKVVSGGQTGADRGALEAAVRVNLATGGFAPRGFMTTAGPDLVLRDGFGLVECTDRAHSVAQMYAQRSMKNVDCSDATVAFRLHASTGTDCTIGYCVSGRWRRLPLGMIPPVEWHRRPCLIVRDTAGAADAIAAFLRHIDPVVLNVCGHRDLDTGCVRRILIEAFLRVMNE